MRRGQLRVIRSTRSALVGGQKMRRTRMLPSRLIGGQIALDGLLQEYRSSKRQKDFFWKFRTDDLHKSDFELFSDGCHAWWIDNHVTPKANSDREKKRKRKSGDDDELNIPADYSAWSVFMAV